MCNCKDEVNQKIKEQTGDPEASLSVIFAIGKGSLESKLYVPYTYRKKKKDGTLTKKEYTGKAALPHCPFCGEKTKADD